MAENAGWWYEQRGKTIIWARNGHIANHTMLPEVYPDKILGTFLHERFGDRYLSYPLVLGEGKRLFEEGVTATLQLVETRPFRSGVVGLIYEPAPQSKG